MLSSLLRGPEFRLRLYRAISGPLPDRWRRRLGESTILAPLRDLLVRRTGKPVIAEGEVRCERLRFRFCAPVQVLDRAQRRGVENRICRVLMKNAPEGGVGLDVGGNFGFLTSVLALSVGPRGRVFTFEADPATADVLAATIAANRFEHVRLERAFVSAASAAGEVPRLAVDDLVEREDLQRIDVLKIDVDGPELDVLQGARRTLARFQPVVVVELSRDQQAIFDLLVGLGYDCVDMQGQAVVPGRWPHNIIAAVGRRLSVPAKGSLS